MTAVGLLALAALSSPALAQAARPNIVVILADDLGYSDIGPYGSEIRTPNLDRLAANGLRFRQFYNAAKCSPTRAALLTGRYPQEVGMGELAPGRGNTDRREPGAYQGHFPPEAVTIADALRAAGYRTYMSGKWHVGDEPEHWPRQHGFDRYFGLLSGASSYYELLELRDRVREMALDDELWFPPAEGFYMTDAFSDFAVERIDQHARENPSQPFFLYLAYTAPHFPLHAPEEVIARYDGWYDAGWDALRAARYAKMREMGVIGDRHVLAPRPDVVPPWETIEDKEHWARRMEVYAAMVDRMDQGIGRVLESLDRNGMTENTLVLFLSDNGACAEDVEGRGLNDPNVPIGARGSYLNYNEPWAYASNAPWRLYKNWVHEGGINTPLIAHWPAAIHRGGEFTDGVAHVIDLLPTALDAAGAELPREWNGRTLRPLEGRSFLAMLRGETPAPRARPLFWAYAGNYAIREGDWKLVRDDKRARVDELFNLAADPTEQRNLAELYPQRVADMKDRFSQWAEKVGANERASE